MNNQSVQSWADRTQSNQMAKFRKQWSSMPTYTETKTAFARPVKSNCFKPLEA